MIWATALVDVQVVMPIQRVVKAVPDASGGIHGLVIINTGMATQEPNATMVRMVIIDLNTML